MLPRAQEVESDLGEGLWLALSVLAGSSGGAGCCWESPGQMTLMVAQSSKFYMLPSKDRHAARGSEVKSALGEGFLLVSSALAGAHGGAGCCWARSGELVSGCR